MNDVHPMAEKGFGLAADTYVRGRPDFPPAALGWLRDDLGLGTGKAAIDLGAGTGKFTRLLVATGATVLAIEPVDAMRNRLARDLPSVTALAGAAQRMPLADRRADAVVCAQAFHWFASAESLDEIHRVLKPGGALGLIWNIRDESVDWVRRLTDIMAPLEGDAPRYHDGEWRRVFPARGFEPLLERRFPHEHAGSPQQVIIDRVASVSFIAALPDARRASVLAEVRSLIDSTPALAGQARVSMPYITRVYWCRRAD